MHPTLLVGPADWEAARMPEQEFQARTRALFERSSAPADGAIVFGNPLCHAALAYFTHFTPKLEAALALITRTGPTRLLVGGGAGMVQAAKPLTFVQDVLPLRNAGEMVAAWLRGLGAASDILLIGGGAMPPKLRRAITDALPESATCIDGTELARTLMRRKSARELALLREACSTLDAAIRAMAAAQRAGGNVAAVILAGEACAQRRHAQDVRTLFSLDGGRTLRPFEMLDARVVDPLQVYVAVRQAGYWAEGFALLATAPSSAAARAGEILRIAIPLLRSGASCAQAARAVQLAMPPWQSHPVTARVIGNGIGLDLAHAPMIATAPDCDGVMEHGEILSMRMGLSDGRGQHAIVSAMVLITPQGNEVLWCSPEATR